MNSMNNEQLQYQSFLARGIPKQQQQHFSHGYHEAVWVVEVDDTNRARISFNALFSSSPDAE